MKTLKLVLVAIFLPVTIFSQSFFENWYVGVMGGVTSSTLYNEDDWTFKGNRTENTWFETGDYELFDFNSGYYGLYVGRVMNDNIALETGLYSYRLHQEYIRDYSIDSESHLERRTHNTVLQYYRIPLQLKLSLDFAENNFLYVIGGASVGFLNNYKDKSITQNDATGTKLYEQDISNGVYSIKQYNGPLQRISAEEHGKVSGLYNEISFSITGGVGFEFQMAENLRGQVHARAELDVAQIENHKAVYQRPDGSEEPVWANETRYPEDATTARDISLRDRTIPFSFGFGVGLTYSFEN